MISPYPGYLREPHYYETDQMGIIHHSNYIRWFEEARIDLLTFLGMPFHTLEAAGISVPVVALDCQYKNMIHYGDRVRIEVYVQQYTGTRMDFAYRVYDDKTEQLMTTGSSKHCFIATEKNRLTSLKKTAPAFHEVFQQFAEIQPEPQA